MTRLFFLSLVFLLSILPLLSQNKEMISSALKKPQQSKLFLVENLQNGKILKLSDKSTWKIAPEDVQKAEIWIFPIPVEIEESPHPLYPYYLINKTTQTKILAKPISP